MIHDKNIFAQLSEGCDKDCRFDVGMSSMSAVYYPPVFDKNGINLNTDGNISTTNYQCRVCGKSWSVKTRLGQTPLIILNE